MPYARLDNMEYRSKVIMGKGISVDINPLIIMITRIIMDLLAWNRHAKSGACGRAGKAK